MKVAGLSLLIAGLLLVAAALMRLGGGARAPFALAGFAVQLVGLGLTLRAHYVPAEGGR
jgi:hypothetical protein